MESKYANIITNDEELRIVMVGKTGVGKSATGNTILGRHGFLSKLSAISLTEDCSKDKAEVDGQKVSVIDTPGLSDTRFGLQKTARDISQCISFAAPGPHVFLVVIRLARFTDEEKQTVQRIQEMFGEAADKYSMVLFTGGDDLDTTIEDFMKGSADLQELVRRCNGKYHVLNNKLQDRSQVSELIKKIKDIVQKNGGSHYTNEMFQEAERAVEEEKQRILKETEEERRKEIEKLEREAQERFERQMEKMNEQMQAEKEREKEEMEEQRRREREEMNEERRREREEMEEEIKRERKAREAEREREREKENEIRMKRLKEEHERKLNEEKEKLKCKQEEEARTKAEKSNPFYLIKKAFKHVVKAITSWYQSED